MNINTFKEIKNRGLLPMAFIKWDQILDNLYKKHNSRTVLTRRIKKRLCRQFQFEDFELALDKEWFAEQVPSEYDERIPVFVLWYQGFESAPAIIKLCRRQLEKVFPVDKYNIIELDKKSLSNWMCLPQDISRKIDMGCISFAHLSDIIRTALLYRLGGYWCDAACLITSVPPAFVEENRMFMFQCLNDADGYLRGSSAFLYAEKRNEILGRTLFLLQEYWKKNDQLVSKDLFQVFITIAADANENSRSIFASISQRELKNNSICAFHLADKFVKSEWDYWNKITFVHKLAWEIDEDGYGEDSVYQYIVNNF